MANNPIPNDDLGEWGESHFRALCAAGGLVANKAERDKMGWDFMVEVPPVAPTPALPLDQRPNGLRCRVQVKTHWRRDDDRVEMSLSAAERLAKDPGPSFVVVLTAEASAGEDLRLVDSHLIHMLDDNLERVLKRLRENEADPNANSLAEQTISYRSKIAGKQFLPKGSALRDALARDCGADPQTYIARKNTQLKMLGYAAGRYEVKTTIKANNVDEFVEMLLGLRPAPAENLETYDTRFGVQVPINPTATRAEIKFDPPSLKCTVRVRGEGLTPPAVFPGEVFLPAWQGIPDEHKRMLVKAPFFSLDLRSIGEVGFKLEADALNNAELDLEDWRNYLRLLEILGEGEVEFDVEGHGPGSPHSPPLKLRSVDLLAQEAWFATLAEVVRCAEALLNLAGAKGKAISLRKLSEAAEMIVRAHAHLFLSTTVPAQTFRSHGQVTPATVLPDIDFLQADCAIVAGVALAYASRLTMRPEPAGDGLLWRQVDIKPEKLMAIDRTVGAFKAFVAAVQQQTGLANSIVRSIDSNDDEAPEEPPAN